MFKMYNWILILLCCLTTRSSAMKISPLWKYVYGISVAFVFRGRAVNCGNWQKRWGGFKKRKSWVLCLKRITMLKCQCLQKELDNLQFVHILSQVQLLSQHRDTSVLKIQIKKQVVYFCGFNTVLHLEGKASSVIMNLNEYSINHTWSVCVYQHHICSIDCWKQIFVALIVKYNQFSSKMSIDVLCWFMLVHKHKIQKGWLT